MVLCYWTLQLGWSGDEVKRESRTTQARLPSGLLRVVNVEHLNVIGGELAAELAPKACQMRRKRDANLR